MRAQPSTMLLPAAAAAVLALIAVLSLLPASVVLPGRWNLGHVLGYALLTGVAGLAIPRARRTLGALLAMAAGVTLVGIAIEWLQPLVGRTTSWKDVLSNEFGVLAGLLGCLIERLARRAPARRPRAPMLAARTAAAPAFARKS